MKADIKKFDLKFSASLFLILAWATLCFTPAQTSDFLYKNSSGDFLRKTFLTASTHTEGDSFEPFALFKTNLSRISFKKASPSNKFLAVLAGGVSVAYRYTNLVIFNSIPSRDFFFLSPPNKASP